MLPNLKAATRRVRANWGVCVLLVILTASLGLNVRLGLAARASNGVRPPKASLIGRVLPPLKVRLGAGPVETLEFGIGRPTVLYALAPGCSWCARNYANVNSLAKAVKDRYRVVGLAIHTEADDLKRHLTEKPLPFPVYFVESEEWLELAAVQGTPTTLVVGPNGRVERVWVGAYSGGLGPEVEKFFGTKLPGLLSK